MLRDDQEEAKEEAVKILKKIDPNHQPYGTIFFEALGRLIVNVGVEAVIVRFNSETAKWEVLLRQRNPKETYPGQWHISGSLIRYGEEIDEVFKRIYTEECGGITASSCHYVGFFNNTKEARGHAFQIVYRCDVEYNGEPKAGLCHWFPFENLPQSTVDHHREIIIPMVARSLGSNENKGDLRF